VLLDLADGVEVIEGRAGYGRRLTSGKLTQEGVVGRALALGDRMTLDGKQIGGMGVVT